MAQFRARSALRSCHRRQRSAHGPTKTESRTAKTIDPKVSSSMTLSTYSSRQKRSLLRHSHQSVVLVDGVVDLQ